MILELVNNWKDVKMIHFAVTRMYLYYRFRNRKISFLSTLLILLSKVQIYSIIHQYKNFRMFSSHGH